MMGGRRGHLQGPFGRADTNRVVGSPGPAAHARCPAWPHPEPRQLAHELQVCLQRLAEPPDQQVDAVQRARALQGVGQRDDAPGAELLGDRGPAELLETGDGGAVGRLGRVPSITAACARPARS